ncbi:hypothetical protein VHP8226_02247 [Vibrio hippocampi]|uniref:Uncharacterized protein n=1 Tax=Vibrio hippocampi TaxID=654686 RepID=A0ABN8DKW8_9VIBR|nr:hypothetical protein VHP8226_02247 [Vibrio hippocampi]
MFCNHYSSSLYSEQKVTLLLIREKEANEEQQRFYIS